MRDGMWRLTLDWLLNFSFYGQGMQKYLAISKENSWTTLWTPCNYIVCRGLNPRLIKAPIHIHLTMQNVNLTLWVGGWIKFGSPWCYSQTTLYLFQAKTTIRKIPSPARIRKSSFLIISKYTFYLWCYIGWEGRTHKVKLTFCVVRWTLLWFTMMKFALQKHIADRFIQIK